MPPEERIAKLEEALRVICEISTGYRYGREGIHLLRINDIAYSMLKTPQAAKEPDMQPADSKRVIVGKLSDQQTRSGKSHSVLDGGFAEAINDGVIPDTPIPRPPK